MLVASNELVGIYTVVRVTPISILEIKGIWIMCVSGKNEIGEKAIKNG